MSGDAAKRAALFTLSIVLFAFGAMLAVATLFGLFALVVGDEDPKSPVLLLLAYPAYVVFKWMRAALRSAVR